MDPKSRNKIRKAIKNSIVIKSESEQKNIKNFIKIHEEKNPEIKGKNLEFFLLYR